ncbi:MAG: NirD/YgiW/YdeI family stress tolerance protein [Alphaproteobacteria bacterium]|nr:MAG: NirD/YgiW/YdeI family stress tolerance protein [Alphaproteobacteria bacterium]
MNTYTKTFAFVAVAATAFAGAAVAQEAVQSVTIEKVSVETTVQPTAMVATHTVKTIMESPKNGADVTLIGTIGAKVGHDRYAFTDRTGMIQIQISKKDMPAGMALGQMVRIDGEIDNTGFFKRITEVDVDRVTLL